MKNFSILIALLVTLLFTSCNKKDDNSVVNFSLNVSSFSTEVSKMKSSLVDDPFAAFTHVYPTNSNITFTSNDGRKYLFYTGDFTLETFKFGLPAGTYKLTGNGGGNLEGSKDMSFTIPEQTVIISSTTVSVSITINPTCFLIIIADPNLLIDETNKPRIADYNTYGNANYILTSFNSTIRYIYGIPNQYAYFMILKKDKSELICDPTSACFKIGYTYKIFINSATTPTVLNPVFQQTDLLNF